MHSGGLAVVMAAVVVTAGLVAAAAGESSRDREATDQAIRPTAVDSLARSQEASTAQAVSSASERGPLLWYHFGESGPSGSVRDDSADPQHGEIRGTPAACVDGPRSFGTDCAMAFSGVRDRVVIPHDRSLDLEPPFTISLWVKPDGSRAIGEKSAILHKDTSGRSDAQEGIVALWARDAVGPSACSDGSWKYQWGDGETRQFVCSGQPLTAGAYQLLTVVHNETHVSLYQNGSLVAVDRAQPFDADHREGWTVSTHFHRTGRLDYPFDGAVDELAFFDRALSDREVASRYRTNDVSPGWQVQTAVEWENWHSRVTNVSVADGITLTPGATVGTYQTRARTAPATTTTWYDTLRFEPRGWADWRYESQVGSVFYDPTPFYASDRPYELWVTMLNIRTNTNPSFRCDPDTVDCTDWANWERVSAGIADGRGGAGTNFQWGQYVDGTFHLFRTLSDESTEKWVCTGRLVRSDCENRGTVLNVSDSGGFYDYRTDTWHLVAEGPSYHGRPDSETLTHWESTNASGLSFHGGNVVFDTDGADWVTGDPDFVRLTDKQGDVQTVYAFTDRKRKAGGAYHVQLLEADGENRTFESVEQVTSIPGGDLETVYVPEYDRFLGFLEMDGRSGGVGLRSSPGPLANTVAARVEFDADGDGEIHESTGWHEVDASYATRNDDATLLTADIGIEFDPIDGSRRHRVSIRLRDDWPTDSPAISGFELANATVDGS